jgi:hypothetical protein
MNATTITTFYQTQATSGNAIATTREQISGQRSASAQLSIREQNMVMQLDAQGKRLEEQERALAFLAGLVKELQTQVQQFAALPAPQAGPSFQTDMAIEIYRTAANGKLYWHMKTSRYAKHGVALWPDEQTLRALGVTMEWLRALPFEAPTPFHKMVTIAVNAEGKKPKVIGLA